MTVCVAAIYDSASILGASDRMLTAGDIQFEPQQSKIRPITTSIAIMIAGSSSLQEEILQRVDLDVGALIATDPNAWVPVADVAEFYRIRCNEIRNRMAENSILVPLGLTHATYLSQQLTMNSEFVIKIATELINFRTPDVEAIIAGVDSSGPHIYVARNSDVACQDGVGFAAIGAGYWHANSQLMFAGHTKQRPLPETLLAVYSAKRRAEVAPGVGREGTDMFFVPSLGKYDYVGDHVLSELERIYEIAQTREVDVGKESRDRIYEFLETLAPPTTTVTEQQTAIPKDGGGGTPADKADVRPNTPPSPEPEEPPREDAAAARPESDPGNNATGEVLTDNPSPSDNSAGGVGPSSA